MAKKFIAVNTVKCKNCGSSEGSVKNGFRQFKDKQTGEMRKVQRRICKRCRKEFYPDTSVHASDKISAKKRIYRLILHLYVSGKTVGGIKKALKECRNGFKDADEYIDDFFRELVPTTRKFLNDLRPSTKIQSYYHCVRKISDDPDYSLYLQEGEVHLAYALFSRNMPSIVNILLDNLPDSSEKLHSELSEQIKKAYGYQYKPTYDWKAERKGKRLTEEERYKDAHIEKK